jgi:hypothetical protein
LGPPSGAPFHFRPRGASAANSCYDRFPLSPRVKALRAILEKLEPPAPKLDPPPPMKPPGEPSLALARKRRRRCRLIATDTEVAEGRDIV